MIPSHTFHQPPLTVLLTGSVWQNYPLLDKNGIQNPVERLKDYLCAIPLWLSLPEVDHVVYCDASGFKIPEEIFDSPKKFESLAFDLKDACLERGKSYSEMISVECAMQHSRFLDRNFFKCTGRLFVRNFIDICRWIFPVEHCFYMMKYHRLNYADTRFFWMNRDCYYDAVHPFLHRVNDYKGLIAEITFYFHAQQYRQLPIPIYIGRSGQNGKMYDEDFNEITKEHSETLLEKMNQLIPLSRIAMDDSTEENAFL